MTKYTMSLILTLLAAILVPLTSVAEAAEESGAGASTTVDSGGASGGTSGGESGGESAAERDARMAWWREAKFGMFIHWGLYAVPAGTHDGKRIPGLGEWIMKDARIPVAEYSRYAATFDPVKFDADAFAATAQAAGMKYMIITAKHHDGFAMYHSAVSKFNIVDATPFKRDPVRELADACAERGIKFGVYYSQSQDWHHPGGGASGGPWDKAQVGDHDHYLRDIALPQVKELLTTVKPAVLWFDTPHPMSEQRKRAFLDLIATQPGLIYNNRLGNGIPGDTETPEQSIPANGFPGRDWETCMTMNDTWGYKSYDTTYKSSDTLLFQLIDITSKGGNYLLNVSPTAQGLIPTPQTDRLREIGSWLKVNGEAIYGASASPFKKAPAWGRVTQRPGRIYLHVLEWPADDQLAVNILNRATRAYLLSQPATDLAITTDEAQVIITLPDAAPDTQPTVVVLEIEGAVQVAPDLPIRQAADGSIALRAGRADVIGSTARIENGVDGNIGYWTNATDHVHWIADVQQAGVFDVIIEYACPAQTAGSTFALTAGDASISGKVASTGSWTQYKSTSLGRLLIAERGSVTITLTPTEKPGDAVMNLRSITLRPVAQ